MLVPRAVVLVRCGGRAIASYRPRLPRDSRRLVRRVAVAMTVPSSAVPVDGDGDGDVGVDVVGGGVGCGMWYVMGGNRASHSKPGSVTDEGVLCLVGLCFLPRSSLHHTHTSAHPQHFHAPSPPPPYSSPRPSRRQYLWTSLR